MSSLEVAELTGKRHDDVMKGIRVTLDEAGIGARKFAGTYIDSQNKQRPCYHLPKFECDLVISGYSVKYRAAIIRRWHELEAESSAPDRSLTRIEQLRRELALLENSQLSSGVIENIRPIRAFGSLAKNGEQRLGLRRAAWVARRSRLEDALQIHRELRELDQAELALGWEGGAA